MDWNTVRSDVYSSKRTEDAIGQDLWHGQGRANEDIRKVRHFEDVAMNGEKIERLGASCERLFKVKR